MTDQLNPCCCGSTNLKELKPYGVESVQCQECHVSLRKQDWNRVMWNQPIVKYIGFDPAKGYKVVPITPTDEMLDAASKATHNRVYPRDMHYGPRLMNQHRYEAMIKAVQG